MLKGENLFQQPFSVTSGHQLLDLLGTLWYHQVAILPPDAVIGLVGKHGMLRNVFPAIMHFRG